MLCGGGRRIINPEIGHHLAGYGDAYPSTGVHDDLSVTAVYLQQDGVEALLLNFDLIGLVAPFNLAIRQAVSQATGVPAEQVFLTATHTHSGPEVRDRFFESGPINTVVHEYNQRVVAWSAEAAKEAKAAAEECVLLYNYAYATENMNRRYFFPDRRGLYIPDNKQLAGTSNEYCDRELGIVAFRKKGTPNQYKAIITNYTCHPLNVGNSSNLCSADYQGYLRRTVEETFAGCLVLSTTGAAGDNHPLMPESGFANAQRMGTTLGSLVITRCYDAVKVDHDQALRLARPSISLRTRDQATSNLVPKARDRQWLPDVTRRGQSHIDTAFSLLGIGPILLAGAPGELLAELGAMIKWSSPFLKSYVLFQATDNIGYIPTRNQYLWGNYEANISPLAAGQGERLVNEILAAAHALIEANPLNLPPRE